MKRHPIGQRAIPARSFVSFTLPAAHVRRVVAREVIEGADLDGEAAALFAHNGYERLAASSPSPIAAGAGTPERSSPRR